jgi:hypothetical protein
LGGVGGMYIWGRPSRFEEEAKKVEIDFGYKYTRTFYDKFSIDCGRA